MQKIITLNPIFHNYITNSIDKIGGHDNYVALIQNILAMIEDSSTFQKENPIELIINDNDIDVRQNSNDEINDLNHEEDVNPPDNDLLNDENINKSEIDDNSIVSIDQYKTKQVYAGESDYDRLIYPLLFWNGEGGCGKLENEVKFNSQLFRYSIISMCMQHPDYYFNKCSALKEEFICSAFGRILQLRINYQYNFHHFMKLHFTED